MLNATPLAEKILIPKARQLDTWSNRIEELQLAQLENLLRSGVDTDYGRRYGFATIKGYDDFKSNVPLCHYEDLRPMVMEMIAGKENVLWKGRVKDYAQSSGTSDGKSKFIPITSEGLSHNHLAGAEMALACYLRNYPQSRIFSGRSFILGGSFANTLDIELHPDVHVGDLSATLISRVPRIIELFYRVPARHIALMPDWEEKLPALVAAASRENVTNISGVPSWFMTVLTSILDYTGKKDIREVWPNIEVFFHGGINFEPYREQYRELMGGEERDIRYVETYNASEGFFAFQDDPAVDAMRLLIDHGVFFEFLRPGTSEPVAAWQVEDGKIYELLVTTANGLWRYSMGDTVKVCGTDPLRVKVVGRTKNFINAFGEEVMVYNADAALLEACRRTGASAINYTAAPLYAHNREKGRHQWLVEFSNPPRSIDEFTHILDEALRRENSDYDAKRSHSLFLDEALVVEAKQGVFDKWLASTGKLGGQRKVPRLSNDRHIIEALLELNR